MDTKLTKINVKVPISESQLKFQLINNDTNKTIVSKVINNNLEEINLDSYHLETHYNYSYAFYEKEQNKWEIISKKNIFPITYDIENELSYSLFEQTDSKKLIIVFSSSIENNRFNYFKVFQEYKANILYLSDENILTGPTTCSYYIGYNGNNNYEVKIINLIRSVIEKLNIEKEDTILFGSSKGGFAALYFTFKYNFGSALVGSPTIYLGRIHRHTAKGKKLIKHLAGEYDNSSLLLIDSLIFNAIDKCKSRPHIFYHVGKGEPRYSKHAIHFLDYLTLTRKATYELDLGNYSNHSLVGEFFPIYAEKVLRDDYKIKKSREMFKLLPVK